MSTSEAMPPITRRGREPDILGLITAHGTPGSLAAGDAHPDGREEGFDE